MGENLQNVYDGLSAALDSLGAKGQEQYESLTASVHAAQDALTDMLSRLAEENSSHQNEILERQEELAEQLQDVYVELNMALTGMQAENNAQHDSISHAIENARSSISKTLSDMEAADVERHTLLTQKLSELSAELLEVNDGLSSQLSGMQKEQGSQNETLMNAVEQARDSLTTVLSEMQDGLDMKVAELVTNLGDIHMDISSSQNDIQKILSDMSNADAEDMDEIIARFTDITTNLGNIGTGMDLAHGDIKSLIDALQSGTDANQAALLEALGRIDSSFSEQNTENFQDLLDSLQSQSDSLRQQLESMNASISQTITEGNSEVLSQMESMESSITNNVTSITSGMSSNQAAVLDKLARMEENTNSQFSAVRGDVQSVFQRVSNGKKLLASALLTKNVVIDEDATFQEIYDGIMKIRQETVIGVDRIPGTITYEYHHHSGSPESGGGCYTQLSYHQHTGSCYKTCEYWESGCRDVVDTNDDQVKCTYMVKHSVCTNGQEQERSRWHANDGEHHVNSDSTGTHLVVVCGKSEGTFEGYKATCGLQEGQIIGAHIIYDANAVSEAARTYQRKAEENGLALEEVRKLLDARLKESITEEKQPEAEVPETEMSETEVTEEVPETEESEEEKTKTEETKTEETKDEEPETAGPEPEESETGTEEIKTEESAAGTKPETESEPESESETEPGTESETKPEPESEMEPGTESEPEAEPETEMKETESAVENETESEKELQTESEQEEGSRPETGEATVPETQAILEVQAISETEAAETQ